MQYHAFLQAVGERTGIAELPLTPEEYVRRVARELDVSWEEARDRIRAVVATIRKAVTIGEFRDVLEQLDPGYADLLA